ncbi:hypothetical protein GXW82_21305 [Streptacidiphilus sp. 4-A2]|nr:hypothetical protein [Streptacidiphilus sp. 4-A2]
MLLPAVAFAAAYTKGQVWSPPQTKLAAPVPVPRANVPSMLKHSAARDTSLRPVQLPRAVDLPTAGEVTTSLPSASVKANADGLHAVADSAPAAARVGSSPLWVAAATTGAAAPSKVQVRFVAPETARQAGFTSGLLFGVARGDAATAAGSVSLQLDPSLLAGESGVTWGSGCAWWNCPHVR